MLHKTKTEWPLVEKVENYKTSLIEKGLNLAKKGVRNSALNLEQNGFVSGS